jgi:hypothetical protein
VQQRGLAPAVGGPGRAFADEALRDQVAHDAAGRAALHPEQAREVGARDGLVGAQQAEHDLAVDGPRRLARGDLEMFGVSSAHFCPACESCWSNTSWRGSDMSKAAERGHDRIRFKQS